MTKLSIAVPDAGPANIPMAEPTAALSEKVMSRVNQHTRFVNLMVTALESGSGIRIKRPSQSDARALRSRLYAARRWFRGQGQTSLERLVIKIELIGQDWFTRIEIEPVLEIEEL